MALSNSVRRHLLALLPYKWRLVLAFVIILLVWVTVYRSVSRSALGERSQRSAEAKVSRDKSAKVRPKDRQRLWQRDRAPWEVKKTGQLLIPARLHHYVGNASGLRSSLLSEVASWSRHHRQFTVYLWDAAHVERHLLSRYTQYSEYYWRRGTTQFERDLLAKVLILYDSGGVLADLHMRSLASVADYISDTTCVMAQERFEKAALMYGLEQLPSTSLLACRPRHEFLRFFLKKITDVRFRTGGRVLQVDTPQFIAHVHLSATSAFDDSCQTVACDFRERLVLAEPDVFVPVIEEELYDSFVSSCRSKESLSHLQQTACYSLNANGNRPTARSLSLPVYDRRSRRTGRELLLPLKQVVTRLPAQKVVCNCLLSTA